MKKKDKGKGKGRETSFWVIKKEPIARLGIPYVEAYGLGLWEQVACHQSCWPVRGYGSKVTS